MEDDLGLEKYTPGHEASESSGIVPNFFRTCFSAGRRMGLLSLINLLGRMRYNRAKYAYLRNMSIPESIHALILLSSANALRATIGAEYPSSRIRRVLCRPSRFGICTSKHAVRNFIAA